MSALELEPEIEPVPDLPELGAPRITRLALENFRSYEACALDIDADLVVLTGPNGAGKTNLLEAVSLFSPGRGLRRAMLEDMTRLAAGPAESTTPAGWRLAATVALASGEARLQTGFTQSGRSLTIDDRPRRGQSALGSLFALMWLTPPMDRLFLEGAANRRRFWDRLVYGFTSSHAAALSGYEQAMRERLRLLRTGRFDAAWLGSLEAAMARQGVAVARARCDALALLDPAMAAVAGAFPAAQLALSGVVEEAVMRDEAAAVEAWLRQVWAEQRRLDASQGVTASGPHRCDLQVRHAAKGIGAAFCSTGEQKALLIAIQLAAAWALTAARGSPPILLLDEITAHLDRQRRCALFESLARLGGQSWLTGTDAGLFDGATGATGMAVRGAAVRAQFFAVEEGRITLDSDRCGGVLFR